MGNPHQISADNGKFDLNNFRKNRPLKLERVPYVNPFIGTGGHGHTFPGAVVPFGMVQLSPDTRNDASWDACGGYYYYDSFIYGFSHTHLSGTGVSDLGDILMQPLLNPEFEPEKYKQRFSHDLEHAEAGYYRVLFPESGIQVELSASLYAGSQRVVFPKKNGRKWLLIDLKHRDALLSSQLISEDSRSIRGHRQSKQWADNQWVFFSTRFSENIQEWRYNSDSTQVILGFDLPMDTLLIQTSLSFTSPEGAFRNQQFTLQNQMLDGDFGYERGDHIQNIPPFENTVYIAKLAWETELSRIKIQDDNAPDSQFSIFYTALYHTMIHPSLASDVDGSYRGRDQAIHKKEHKTYHVFSLWDTYRSLHPLLSMIDKNRTRDFILTMLDQYEDGGRLPVWELGSCETNCMIGFHSVPVILDAIKQGIYFSDEEQKRIWKAVTHSSDYKELAYEYHIPIANELLTLYGLKLGYIDVLNQSESVSKTLEYAFDDACVAALAKEWGFEKEYATYQARSERWKGLWDNATRSFRPRQNGMFLEPYFLNEVNNHYTEANAWQYRFAVPQDLPTLIQYFGGNQSFDWALDSLFQGSSETKGREQADITGLIGQYAHGNEPSHHMAYLYNAVGKPAKAQALISKIQKEFYTTGPDGYIGNEDCGQMSAWHVLSALGIYPVAPGSGQWSLGVPWFDSVLIFQSDASPISITRAKRTQDQPIGNAGYWSLSEGHARNKYQEKFIEIPENYSQLIQKRNGVIADISQDFLMIHRAVHFEWIPINELEGVVSGSGDNQVTVSELGQNGKIQPYLPQIISPSKVKKGAVYDVQIKGASVLDPVYVMIRLMDENLDFGAAKLNFEKEVGKDSVLKWIPPTEDVRILEPARIPGFGAHHLGFWCYSDTQIRLQGSTLVWAAYFQKNDWADKPFTARYIHEQMNDFKVLEIKGAYNSQYSGGGDDALIDGVFGSEEWRSGSWQGYQKQDFEAIIDLNKETHIDYLGARFLSDERAWIFLPTNVEWEYSHDGIKYKPFNNYEFKYVPRDAIGIYPIIMGHKKRRKGVDARYIKVKAKNFGKLPKGHPGYDFDGDAFIFIDEILINPTVMTLE